MPLGRGTSQGRPGLPARRQGKMVWRWAFTGTDPVRRAMAWHTDGNCFGWPRVLLRTVEATDTNSSTPPLRS
ncbi:hypothetical protein ACFPN7_02310 [Amycolatopsis halotolerans]|uniref:hypothetical protein n=1 Tax=Amycolatopsis halotolerans TaxID=330083 RepID=UPI00361B7FF4